MRGLRVLMVLTFLGLLTTSFVPTDVNAAQTSVELNIPEQEEEVKTEEIDREPSKESDKQTNNQASTTGNNSLGKQLPKTNESKSNSMGILGALLLSMAAILKYASLKKRMQ